MTSITIDKKNLEKMKLLTKKIIINQITIFCNESTKEVSFCFNSTEEPKNGFTVTKSEIVISQKNLKETFVVSITDDNKNFVSFISNASEQDENVILKVDGNADTVTLSVGDVNLNLCIFKAPIPKKTKFIEASCPSPIISFNKKDFKSQIIDRTKNLTIQNEWIDEKLSGINLIISEDHANVFVATKTFHFKAPITKGVFYPESSKAFVHNDGIIFLTEDFINDVYLLMNENDEVKFFSNSSCVEDESFLPYDVVISDNIIIRCLGLARSKNILNKNKFDEEISSDETVSIKIETNSFKKFFGLFKNSETFSNNVIKIASKKGRGLNFRPLEAEDNKFEYFIENKSIVSDMEFDVNFFVLSSIIPVLNGEELFIKETSLNKKHFIISDGSSWFVIGKSIKQE